MGRSTVASLNPEVLVWARERAGYSIEDVAARLNKDVPVVAAWEAGQAAPTYVQLEKLAYELYKRPIAIFFFPSPPSEPEAGESFRTLPEVEIRNLTSDTLFKVRKARAFQESLKELNGGKNPSPRRIFDDIRLVVSQKIEDVAEKVRGYLNVDLAEQKLWKNPDEALKMWRAAVEDSGVFVFKDALKEKAISGFCLVDTEFPVIYVNNSTSHTRQIFTLFHELAHILLSTSGITKLDDSYVSLLVGIERQIEIFCNAFAAELLVPMLDFKALSASKSSSDEDLAALAQIYSVSREVVLRRYLQLGRVDSASYRSTVKRWRESYKKRGAKASGGGHYYNTQAAYLGKKYLELAFSKFYKGECTREQLAGHLNVKVRSIPGLEDAALR